MATPDFDPDLTPAGKPPPGVTSNLKNPPSEANIIVICMVVYLLISTPIVIARMYTRQFINRHLWWDDCKTPAISCDIAMEFLIGEDLQLLDTCVLGLVSKSLASTENLSGD